MPIVKKSQVTWKLDPNQDLKVLVNSESARSLEEAFDLMEFGQLKACEKAFFVVGVEIEGSLC